MRVHESLLRMRKYFVLVLAVVVALLLVAWLGRSDHGDAPEGLTPASIPGAIGEAGADDMALVPATAPRESVGSSSPARSEAKGSIAPIAPPGSPAISGIVVDDSDVPVADVTVYGWPTKSGGGVSTRTREDGTFTLSLRANEPYTLEIQGVPDVEHFGRGFRRGDPARTFEPGKEDARLVLVRSKWMTYRVMDALSRRPIEEFGIRVIPKRMGYDYKEVDLDDHPGGEALIPLAEVPSIVIVRAVGHAPIERDVAPDEPGKHVQTIALETESGIDGRLVFDRGRLSAASLFLQREELDDTGRSAEEIGMRELRFDVGAFPGRPRESGSAIDGSFSFGELAAGTWRLRIEAPGAARTTLRRLAVPHGRVLHLGNIVVAHEAIVRGRIVTSPGISPVGFTLLMDRDRVVQVEESDGGFEFKGLEAGPHTLTWSRDRKISFSPDDARARTLTLAAGDERGIVIDTRDSDPCTVLVRVTRGGLPVPRVEVVARVPRESGGRSVTLGYTDSQGGARGKVEGGLPFELVAINRDKRPVGIGARGLRTTPGGRIEQTIELSTGSLVVEMPASSVTPDGSFARIELEAEGREPLSITTGPKGIGAIDGASAEWTEGGIKILEVMTGTFVATVTIEHRERSDQGPWRTSVVLPAYSCPVTIEEGREARIVVP
jgi:hypothetical protein